MERACVKIRAGSGFFVSPEHIVTCWHVIKPACVGDRLSWSGAGQSGGAVVAAIDADCDLALLKSDCGAPGGRCLPLDRVAPPNTGVTVWGYPHAGTQDDVPGVELGELNEDRLIPLSKANGVTQGYSGGPAVSGKNRNAALGVLRYIAREDENGRRADSAWLIPAEAVLEHWEGLVRERRFEVRASDNRFVYSALKTDFRDPMGNLSTLRTFLEDARDVLWWAVVGKGGTGKSRLAYELASSLSSAWSCCLLRAADLRTERLDALAREAARDLLLIADYAYFDTGELGAWLAAQNPEHKIRVLLLQRESREDSAQVCAGWERSLLRGHNNLTRLRYRETDLRLGELEEKDTVALMRSYVERSGADASALDFGSLYTVLERTDPELTRPLFAMFIADAAMRGDDPTSWEPEDALSYFCNRELDRMEQSVPEELIPAARRLWVLATICGGFPADGTGLEDCLEPEELSALSSALTRAHFARRADGVCRMQPMKPDLLGEYFVLRCFGEQRGEIGAILRAASCRGLQTVRDFLLRMFSDYETDTALAVACCGADPAFHPDVSLGLQRRTDTVRLRELYARFGGSLWLSRLAKGLFNRFNAQLDPKDAAAVLDELRVLYEANRSRKEVTVPYAMGLFNFFLDQSEPRGAWKVLDALKALWEETEEETESFILRIYARGLLELLRKQTEPEKAREALSGLRVLYVKSGRAEFVAEQYAEGLDIYCGVETSPEQLAAAREKLERIYARYPMNAAVRARYTSTKGKTAVPGEKS